MRSYTLTAPAKINLYLEILGDRPDGYHELAMILQSIELADKIDLRAISTDNIRLRTSHPHLPTDNSNLAYKAAALMAAEFPEAFAQYGGVEINIDKHIPIAAGLAGGSSDAAAVLVGLDLMWKLGLTQDELETLASQLGSDVPFCIAGGTAIATGRGDNLSPLPTPEDIYIVLGKYRHIEVSTAWAYQTYRSQFGSSYVANKQDLDARASAVHSSSMVHAIVHEDKQQIGQKLYNDLEKVVLPNYPQVAQLKQAFQQAGCLGTMMSGSGSTVFALCESQSQAGQVQQQIRTSLTEPNLDLWTTRLCGAGVQVLSSTRD